MTRLMAVPGMVVGLVPMAYLVQRRWRVAQRIDAAFWWVASALAVSFAADVAAFLRLADPFLVGLLYPVSQSALLGAVFLTRADAIKWLLVLVGMALIDVITYVPGTPDILLRCVAWAGLVGILVDRPNVGNLRYAILTAFGLGLLAWIAYVFAPGWVTYIGYQVVRAVGAGLFCFAVADPKPVKLTLHRARTA